jgi:hypothetical protein
MKSAAENKIYWDNLKILQTRMPEVCTALASDEGRPSISAYPHLNRSGEINATCSLPDGSQVALHEDEDIFKGAVRLMANWKLKAYDALVFHGFGIGYGPLAALNTFDHVPRIIIVETQPEIFKMALRLVDLRPLLSYERLSLYIGGDLSPFDIIEECKEIISFGTTRLVDLPAYALIFGRSYRIFNQKLQRAIGAMRDVWHTAKTFGRQMISSTMDNLPSLVGSTPLAALKDKFKGIPAVYVAAGPSLDDSLVSLKKVGNQALIISSDSAVAALIRNKIAPHFIVTVDQHKMNFEKIRPVLNHLREPVLVFGVESNPDNVRACLSCRRIAVTADSNVVNSWLGPRFNMDSKLPGMNSVSLAAIHTARLLGCEPIVLVGMDLSYSGPRSHSKMAANHYTPDKNKKILLDGANGSLVYSLPQFASDKASIERTLAAGGFRIINTAVNGAFVKGTEIKSLAAVLEQDFKPDVDVSTILSSLDWLSVIPLTDIFDELQLMQNRLAEFKNSCQTGRQKSAHALALVREGFQVSNKELLDLNSCLQRFQEDNKMLITLLQGARLDSVQELFRKREQIEYDRKTIDARQILNAELEIIVAFFQSHYDTALFFEAQIKSKSDYFARTIELMAEPLDSDAKYLHLARHQAAAGEFWQAEEAYRKCLKLDRTNETAWQEIIELYTAFGMWPGAKTQLEAAVQYLPRSSQPIPEKKKISFENSSQVMK